WKCLTMFSIPKLSDPPASRLSSIGGTPPETGRRPKGCPFAPRCPLAENICQEKVPQLEPLSGSANHRAACFVVQRM
ncbi:oligopeptide/dipeptide ABC transporter ATP-binding protein, partial [Rhizobium leguminosarum]|uniref:oligopeptide/dipeptide ABC transporter ATP-binding protein n=1 Tax=Rhizobium leguminosarum TaxID=384 RepID=UPI003F9A599B